MIVRELNLWEVFIRIFLSMILGGIIGIDRSLKNRPAGMRTHMLVSIGACLVMLINQYIYQEFKTSDPARMGAQVVSGIGFLGAGTIIISHHRKITGLTTAASLWASASVGLSLGIGFYEAALIGGAAIFASVSLLLNLDDKIDKLQKDIEIYVELHNGCTLKDFLHLMYHNGYKVSQVQMPDNNIKSKHITMFTCLIKSDERIFQTHLIEVLENAYEVADYEIL